MTSFDATTQLERQLSSLFRAEAQDAHLPSGTWQTISPKMGEPDAPSVLWQLRNAFSFPRWRNPMKVKYATSAATIAMIVIAAILFVMLVNADDSEGPVPASSPTPVPATPTPEATPTATPAPDEVIDLRNPDPSTLVEKPIPAAIDPGLVSETPTDEVVVQSWTEFFSDSIYFFPPQGFYHVCGDGRIVSVDETNKADLVLDVPDTWSIVKSGASASSNWWEVSFTGKLNLSGGRLGSLFVVGIEDGFVTTTADGGKTLTLFESEYCKTSAPQSTSTPITASQTPVSQLPVSKPFPAALRSDSDPLPSDEVIALWTDYLAGTDILGEHYSRFELRLCGDGSGDSTVTRSNTGPAIVAKGTNNSSVDQMVVTWEVRQFSERWNEVTVWMGLSRDLQPGADPNLIDTQRLWDEDGVLVGRNYETIAIVAVTDDESCASEGTSLPATPAPEPTAIPTALATVGPTATPVPPISVPLFTVPDASQALPIPAEIDPGLTPQSSSTVVDAWTDYFNGSVVRIDGFVPAMGGGIPEVDNGKLDLAFCGDSRGVIIGTSLNQDPAELGEIFTWSGSVSPAGRWYELNLTAQMLNPSLVPLFDLPENGNGRVPGESRTFSFTVDGGMVKTFVFDVQVFNLPVVEQICSQLPAA